MNISVSEEKRTSPFIICKDHSVSGEKFELHYDKDYDMLLTKPIPERLDNYYKSDAYISHTDGKRNLLEFLYQLVKNVTIKKKLSYLDKYHPDKGMLLDIGAGTGDFLKNAGIKSWQIHGIEPSEDARKLAAKKGIFLNADLSLSDTLKFDVITMWHVLEHVTNLREQVKVLKENLNSGGTIFIAVPNFKSNDATYYKEFWAAYDVPRHIWHFSQNSIRKIFDEHNMKVCEVIPMKFDAYYVSILSEKYKGSSLGYIKALYRGFISNWKARRTNEYSSLIYVIKNA
ncbi:class I SAM-dependent methyltransferase [Flavobacteriaceae bacterium M23B6Z8]